MTAYRSNGTPAGFAPACRHESARGRDNAVWVCDECGHEWPKTAAEREMARPAWTYAAENLPAAREAGYDA